MLKKVLSICLIFSLLGTLSLISAAEEQSDDAIAFDGYSDVVSYVKTVGTEAQAANLDLGVRSGVLMEASTGTVLYSENMDEKLPPASVTKVMSLLLIMEALDNGSIKTEDMVTTSEHAASMGGTQIYLEVGEQMCVNDLIKAIAVPSANDATVAMAEYIAGSESEFVRRMNERASQLGAKNTNFTSCTGLFDDSEHYTSAYDIALITKELLKHSRIFDYTKIWMDTLRDGGFGLASTNKMLRTYTGMTGMKTGYTKLSKYCFSGTAERDGMSLIAVVMGAETSNDRFAATAKMLDFGFASFSVATAQPGAQDPIRVTKGTSDQVKVAVQGGLSMLVGKGQDKLIQSEVSITDTLQAPVAKGTEVGYLTYTLNGEVVKTCPIVTTEEVPKATFLDYFGRIFQKIVY